MSKKGPSLPDVPDDDIFSGSDTVYSDEDLICVPGYSFKPSEPSFDEPVDKRSDDLGSLSVAEKKELLHDLAISEDKLTAFEMPEPKELSFRDAFNFSLSKKQIIDGVSADNEEPVKASDTAGNELFDDDDDVALPNERFHWRPAIRQSLMFLSVQHGYALIFQEKTRRALKGPFFRDYWRSIKGTSGWDDGNRFFTNYIAHPMQGGLTGFIYVQNHDRLRKQMFAESRQYWRDRAKAFAWSVAWSTQFELGPISQPSIGNVGMYGKMGYVDLVITPTVGTAWLLSEEAIDRYLIRHIETRSFIVKMMARMFLNPMRTMANLPVFANRGTATDISAIAAKYKDELFLAKCCVTGASFGKMNSI